MLGAILGIIEKIITAFTAWLRKKEREQIEAAGAAKLEKEQRAESDELQAQAEEIYSSFAVNPDFGFLLSPTERGEFVDRLQNIQTDLSKQRGSGESVRCSNTECTRQDLLSQCCTRIDLFEQDLKNCKRELEAFFIHCTASDSSHYDNVEAVRKDHKARGWADIGYHYMITKDGMLHNGRDIDKTPAAQKGHNTGSVAVVLSGLDHFNNEQFVTLKLIVDIAKKYSLRIRGHREVSNRACPNFDYKKLLDL